MYRDVSELPTDGVCYHIIDDSTLNVYLPSSDLESYKLVTDKYLQTQSTNYTPPVDTSLTCTTYSTIQELPSKFDFITPVYHLMGIMSILFIVFCAYRLMIYPFFRKTT